MTFKDQFPKIKYSDLKSRQKENFNFHKVASVLANYGFNSMRLNDDWQGADFISVHISNGEIIKVQLKGRFTIDKKYIQKDLYIAFIENEKIKIYMHDDAIDILPENIKKSNSWKNTGLYSWGKTPVFYDSIITVLNN
ncbi:MAG: hypothetical protein P8K68_03965 [Algibacter sp.]|uniref:hypothetical protein n=1 Tax=Algibacter sp. TaxID=1872428 RepID=UPI00260EAC7F|nr:hypothetical protein [Algibacter sp.]MDG1729775.1 hypothetical protein [Algibacter sp.]MDG2177929.1 hypothetical protein [Algibacter sp.]